MAFKFVRTGTGELSGPSMIYQIEQGFDDTAASAEEARKTAENAEATANKALEEATEATAVADVALKTAQDAQASAGAAQNRADEAWNAATGGGESAESAMRRADAAYDLADTANANALSAQAKADTATDAAEAATTASNAATDAATVATDTANEALSSAGMAETTATQAASDVAVLKAIVSNVESAIDEFEVDNYTTSLDSIIVDLVKKHITGNVATALPTGVTAPFWFYNWTTDTLATVFQFIQKGASQYGRQGTPSGVGKLDGTDTYYITFATEESTGATSVVYECASNAITAETAKGYTWTTTSTQANGIEGTLALESTTPDGTTLSIGGVEVGTVTNGALVITSSHPIANTVSNITLTGGTITASSTVFNLKLVWTALTATGCAWAAWAPLIDNDGVVRTTGNQTIAGVKTFTNTPIGTTPESTATGNEIVTASWVNAKIPSLDGAVTTTGNQSISGVKTFTTGLALQAVSPNLTMTATDSDDSTGGVTILGNVLGTSQVLGAFSASIASAGTISRSAEMRADGTGWGAGTDAIIKAVVTYDGVQYGIAPSTPVGSDSNEIVTADWATKNPVGTCQIFSSASGTLDIDISKGNYARATITGNTTLTISGVVENFVNTLFMWVTNGGSYTISYGDMIHWPEKTAPTLTASGTDLLMFITYDNGITWFGNYRLDMGTPE